MSTPFIWFEEHPHWQKCTTFYDPTITQRVNDEMGGDLKECYDHITPISRTITQVKMPRVVFKLLRLTSKRYLTQLALQRATLLGLLEWQAVFFIYDDNSVRVCIRGEWNTTIREWTDIVEGKV